MQISLSQLLIAFILFVVLYNLPDIWEWFGQKILSIRSRMKRWWIKRKIKQIYFRLKEYQENPEKDYSDLVSIESDMHELLNKYNKKIYVSVRLDLQFIAEEILKIRMNAYQILKAEKNLADRHSTDSEKRVAEKIKKDCEWWYKLYWEFLRKDLESLGKSLDRW